MKSKATIALPILLCSAININAMVAPSKNSNLHCKKNVRRAFIAKAFTSVVSSAAVFGVGHVNDHRCNCAICIGGNVANAYYQSDAGDETSSALTKAFNAQAKLTNSRLEAQGFPLDTKEEEEERIRNAFQSFSYESNVTKQGIRKSATDNGRFKKDTTSSEMKK